MTSISFAAGCRGSGSVKFPRESMGKSAAPHATDPTMRRAPPTIGIIRMRMASRSDRANGYRLQRHRKWSRGDACRVGHNLDPHLLVGIPPIGATKLFDRPSQGNVKADGASHMAPAVMAERCDRSGETGIVETDIRHIRWRVQEDMEPNGARMGGQCKRDPGDDLSATLL